MIKIKEVTTGKELEATFIFPTSSIKAILIMCLKSNRWTATR